MVSQFDICLMVKTQILHEALIDRMRYWLKDMERDIRGENGVCPECNRRLGEFTTPYHPGIHTKDCDLASMLVDMRVVAA